MRSPVLQANLLSSEPPGKHKLYLEVSFINQNIRQAKFLFLKHTHQWTGTNPGLYSIPEREKQLAREDTDFSPQNQSWRAGHYKCGDNSESKKITIIVYKVLTKRIAFCRLCILSSQQLYFKGRVIIPNFRLEAWRWRNLHTGRSWHPACFKGEPTEAVPCSSIERETAGWLPNTLVCLLKRGSHLLMKQMSLLANCRSLPMFTLCRKLMEEKYEENNKRMQELRSRTSSGRLWMCSTWSAPCFFKFYKRPRILQIHRANWVGKGDKDKNIQTNFAQFQDVLRFA